MNNENQHTENKETWRDEYMKTLAAFANTDGGSLCIGINDNGEAVGLENSRELLEYLPNKIVQKLNIHPLVKYIEKDGQATIEIVVDAYDYAVSYNGKYYIRTGSTTQVLSDRELQRFLLKKANITWETQTDDNFTIDDIDLITVNKFKRYAGQRIPEIAEENNLDLLLRKLNLMNKAGKLNKAAILLFGKNPQNYIHTSFIKIGKFASETDIVSDDIIEGNLFVQLEKTLELLRTKYLFYEVKGYKDWRRIEELEYPYEALREAIINALIHKDYLGTNTTIKIFANSIQIWNSGKLLEGLTVKKLKTKHISVRRNELICNAFYKAGMIEAWGRGTTLIIDQCKQANLPEPIFSEYGNGIEIAFERKRIINQPNFDSYELNDRQLKIIEFIKEHGKITRSDYISLVSAAPRTILRDIEALIDKNILVKNGANKKNTFYTLKNDE